MAGSVGRRRLLLGRAAGEGPGAERLFSRNLKVLALWPSRNAALCSSQSNKLLALPAIRAPTLTVAPWPEQGKTLVPSGTEIQGSEDLEEGGVGSPWGTRLPSCRTHSPQPL